MSKAIFASVVSAASLVASPAALAEGQGLQASVQVGTLGLGIGAAWSVAPHLDLRGLLNTGRYSRSGTSGDLDYDAKLKAGTGDVLVDWYPFAGGFRLTGGVSLGDHTLTLRGKPTEAGTYKLNGISYAAPAGASVTGTVKLADGLTPYIGLGFGTRAALARGLDWHVDVGALVRSPKATLTSTGLSGLSLEGDLESERVKLQDKLDRMGVYPVFSVGASYRF